MKQLFSHNGFENTFMTHSCVNVKLISDILHHLESTYVDKWRTYFTITETKHEVQTSHLELITPQLLK